MSSRAAEAAKQSDPNCNGNFRRWWGDAGATGPDWGTIRSWHAGDVAAPSASLARRRAEAAWQRIMSEAAR